LRGAFGGEQGVCSRLSGRAGDGLALQLDLRAHRGGESADKQARSSNC
jgi:hypothetical protein